MILVYKLLFFEKYNISPFEIADVGGISLNICLWYVCRCDESERLTSRNSIKNRLPNAKQVGSKFENFFAVVVAKYG
jgi:hypothetical protein